MPNCINISHPDPGPKASLDQRIGRNAVDPWHSLLARNLGTQAVCAECYAVISALDRVTDTVRRAERIVAVRAAPTDSYCFPVFPLAVEHNRIAEYSAGNEFLADIFAETSDVPGIAGREVAFFERIHFISLLQRSRASVAC